MKKMSKVRKINKLLLVAFAGASILLLFLIISGWYYVVAMGRQANSVSTEVSNLKTEAKELATLATKFNKISDEQSLVIDALPKEKRVSEFLADFEGLVKKDNLTLYSSQVGDTKSKTKGALSQTVKKDTYLELPIKVEVRGSYSDFYRFLTDLKTLRRLNSVSDLVLHTQSTGSSDSVTANFTTIIYLKQE
jgi:Tfp pilus assembly protein PilO